MQIVPGLDRANQWMLGAHALTDGLSFATSSRARVGVALLNLSGEHQMAIHTLANNKLMGSAIAMFRPQFETCVRGTWYLHCATDDQVDSFIAGGEPPNMTALLNAVEALPDYGTGILMQIKDGTWRRLCDYTHGGITQVKGRVREDSISNNLNPKFISAILDASVLLACIAASTLVMQTDKPERAQDLFALYNRLVT